MYEGRCNMYGFLIILLRYYIQNPFIIIIIIIVSAERNLLINYLCSSQQVLICSNVIWIIKTHKLKWKYNSSQKKEHLLT